MSAVRLCYFAVCGIPDNIIFTCVRAKRWRSKGWQPGCDISRDAPDTAPIRRDILLLIHGPRHQRTDGFEKE